MGNVSIIDISKKINVLGLAKPWFFEGLFYSTLIALLWSNEEPSKLNTLFASWSAYAIVAASLFYFTRSGDILRSTRWIRVFFAMSILMLVVCDFVWMRGYVVRTLGSEFDPVRFDGYAELLAQGNMSPQVIIQQNHTGTIWYAGFIYWVFGVSKYYVVLFNGALTFVSCALFASLMGRIEGNPVRWQWLCLGMLLPDFIIHGTNVSKEPLSVLLISLGVWGLSKAMAKKGISYKWVFYFIFVAIIGLAVRAAVSAVILLIALIWFWKFANIKRRIVVVILFLSIFFGGQAITDFITKVTGSTYLNWTEKISVLTDSEKRIRDDTLCTTTDSWNLIMERLPVYFLPVTAPVKGFFMMIAPMPFWQLHLKDILEDVVFKRDYTSQELRMFFPKANVWLFVISFPCLLAGMFDAYRVNRRLWLLFPLTFAILVSFMGLSIYGMIEPRYRPMLLLFWLATAGIGHYYGRPKLYILPAIVMFIFGGIIYFIPKGF